MPTNQTEEPVAIVTGANGVIGKAIAAGIAKAGFAVVMVCRDEKRAARALDEVRRVSGSSDVRVELADLSRRESVFALAARWQGRLDVLLNNAAIAPRRRSESPEGIELQFATNVLGYLWMMRAFEATASARNRPEMMWGSEPVSSIIEICPAMRSAAAGPLPLYGTCRTSIFATFLKRAPARCCDAPMPAEP